MELILALLAFLLIASIINHAVQLVLNVGCLVIVLFFILLFIS